MAKRERDRWRVYADKPTYFGIEETDGDKSWIYAEAEGGGVTIDLCGAIELTPARAIQFARKVQDIAARAANKAAKEAKRERDGAERAEKGGGDGK